eukprot:4394679-Heterocapsa_arctica.AAC.1
MIRESGVLEPVGGLLGVGEEGVETCTPPEGEHRVLDFWIMGPGFRETHEKVEVIQGSSIATHRRVRLSLEGDPRVVRVLGLKTLKAYVLTPEQL